ncbi:MAG TPA: hypothetical protein VF986_00045 [Actinomycetota bacterium]
MLMQAEAVKEQSPPPAEGIPSRRRFPVVPILVLVAILGGLVWLVLVRSSPAQQVRRLIDKQLKLTLAGRYDLVYGTLSPRVKAACPQQAFEGALQEITSTRPEFWTLVEYRDLRIDVKGDRAIVTYVITYNGAPVERATPGNPDLYVRAPRTIYGPTLSVAQQLENLDHLRAQRLVIGKEYDKERAAIIAHGPIKLVESIKGQWYDDGDGHVRCG